jgi:hypothetical protein
MDMAFADKYAVSGKVVINEREIYENMGLKSSRRITRNPKSQSLVPLLSRAKKQRPWWGGVQ